MKPHEQWIPLLEKALRDELVVDRLMTFQDSPLEIIGFHLQQAAEKLLKAALSAEGVQYRRTHNIGELIHLFEDSDRKFPESLGRLRDLTPYAAELRYDFIPLEEEEDFDLSSYRKMVTQLRSWVETLIEQLREETKQ